MCLGISTRETLAQSVLGNCEQRLLGMIHAWDSPKVSPWHGRCKGEQPWLDVLREIHGPQRAHATQTEEKHSCE